VKPVAPIMVRAAITPDEWAAVRKLAIDRNTPAAQLIAHAIRRTLLKGGKP
jgi:hypothetical protein